MDNKLPQYTGPVCEDGSPDVSSREWEQYCMDVFWHTSTCKGCLQVGKPKIIIELRDKTYTINVKMNHHVKAKIIEKHRSTAKLLMESAIRNVTNRDLMRIKQAQRIRIVMERHGKHCDDDNLPTAGKYFRDGIADVLGAHRGVKPNKKGHYDDSLPCYQWEYTQCPKIKGSLTTYRVMVYWE